MKQMARPKRTSTLYEEGCAVLLCCLVVFFGILVGLWP